jgi:hypothetical protein
MLRHGFLWSLLWCTTIVADLWAGRWHMPLLLLPAVSYDLKGELGPMVLGGSAIYKKIGGPLGGQVIFWDWHMDVAC